MLSFDDRDSHCPHPLLIDPYHYGAQSALHQLDGDVMRPAHLIGEALRLGDRGEGEAALAIDDYRDVHLALCSSLSPLLTTSAM
jgi:hypothetical protein